MSSDLREEVSDIPEAERNLHRALTRITWKVRREMNENDVDLEDLADKLDKTEDYVHRMLGGGINLSLRTLMELENILDTNLIDAKKPEISEETKRRRRDTN